MVGWNFARFGCRFTCSIGISAGMLSWSMTGLLLYSLTPGGSSGIFFERSRQYICIPNEGEDPSNPSPRGFFSPCIPKIAKPMFASLVSADLPLRQHGNKSANFPCDLPTTALMYGCDLSGARMGHLTLHFRSNGAAAP